MEFTQLTAPTTDLFVHDISFDYYGKRFATCTTDGKIKVWDRSDEAGSWRAVDIPEAHSGSIWRLSWAHPEFGSMIASCSEDRTVSIWEEQISISSSIGGVGGAESKDSWIRKAQLTDCRKPVNDVKFSPRHLGLKLAAACADGMIRIYEATDVFSLNFWQLQYCFQVEDTTMSDGYATPSETSTRQSEHGLTCLAWLDNVFEASRIAIGGYSRRASIWCFDTVTGHWTEELELEPSFQGGVIHDIAWSPVMGRSYHLIATASRDKWFKIHTVVRLPDGSLQYSSTHTEAVESPVWRVTWNASGTVLATSAEDGTLGLWRRDFAGHWKNIQQLPSGAESTRRLLSLS